MSAEENTRLVQNAYEAFGRGDVAAFAELIADDIEWVDPGDPDDDPNAGTFRGKEAVLGWFGGLASTLDYTTFEPREFIAQNDKMVSLVYSEATVRGTGRAFVNAEAHVWTIRDRNSPDSRAITTPQRRLLPIALARATFVAWASVRECHHRTLPRPRWQTPCGGGRICLGGVLFLDPRARHDKGARVLYRAARVQLDSGGEGTTNSSLSRGDARVMIETAADH